MRLRNIIQLASSVSALFLSTLGALYEGSSIQEDVFEWEWSTPFTLFTTNNISSADQISILDYLLYAAKFQPLFPSIMLLSFVYILILAGYIGIKNRQNHTFYFSILACVMMAGCLMILSDHVETKIIYAAILFAGTFTSVLIAIKDLTYINYSAGQKTK